MTSLRIATGMVIAGVWITILLGMLYLPQVTSFLAPGHTITIAAWGDIFDPHVLADFEKETGIKIRMSYYTSNEELLVKLKKTGGKGFDLIVPSDYAVPLLRDEKLLKKLDRTKINFYHDLNPVLLGHAFDPHNEYSLPWLWELYGVGIDADFFDGHVPENPWDLIFLNPEKVYRITMVNDPIEMVMLAALYVYGDADDKSPERLSQITRLLIEQKKWVKAYVDYRADYFLATKNCAAVVSSSSYILRSQKDFAHVQFLVPQKTFVTIENCAISAASEHEKEIYQLLNYLYKTENVVKHSEQFSLFPATLSALPFLKDDDQLYHLATMSALAFSHLAFFKKQSDQIDLIHLWTQVKS